eukprot:TRINITY_DN15473_c0_g1_i1.p1 TRINITY_DN15473_c0_g1~~TRINITY_DN15473_c0_g1_i1.p1  ORF type:complete len:519 (-),score=89.47 TRINITY_DN15473_c0_g1_i1:130-1686(-)
MNDTLEDSRKEDHDGKRKRSSSSSDDEDKKKRVKWAGHLHDQFLRAVQKLGEKAVPSAILNEMGVEGLTRENVASHLQKYRVQTREKLLSEYLKSNSGAGFGSMDDMRGPSEYSQPPPEAYLRRRSESELSYYHSHNYRNPVHPYPPYHLPPSAVHSSSNHSAPPPPPSHAPVPNEPPGRSAPYDHPPPFPNYHGPPHANNYSGYPNYGYGHSGNGRSASFSYNPRDYHGGAPPGGNAGGSGGPGGYNSIEPFADFDSPPSWRTGQQLVVSAQPPPLPPTQRSNSFSEPAPRRPSYNEAMMQSQMSQPPPQPPPSQSTFVEPPARRPSFSGEGRRGSFSTEGRRGSFSDPSRGQQQPQQTHQPPPQQQPQHSQPPQHSGLSSLPSLPPPPSIRTSYDSVPTSVLTGGSSNYFDVNTPTSSEYSSDVLLSLSENHSSQMTPTTISFPPPSPSPEPSSAQSKDPFSDFPHIGDRASHNDSYSSSYPAHAHTAPNAGYSNYHHHSCGNSWCTGCSKVEEQV